MMVGSAWRSIAAIMLLTAHVGSALLFVKGFASTSSSPVPNSPHIHLLQKKSPTNIYSTAADATESSGSSPAPPTVDLTIVEGKKPSVDWELDCYSRPVVAPGGKKLWEVLVTDSTGSFRFCKTLPSNQVNSKELRKTVEELMDDASLPIKPTTIRFFRGAMFNMINIALSDLDVVGRPSRCTYSIAQWLEERHRDVYPKMEG
jgi:RNA-binding protein Tab2/Atab2